jgi:multiple sugar transport system substrate-binding protein
MRQAGIATSPYFFRLIAGVASAGLLMAGCGGRSGGGGSDAPGYNTTAAVTITWWTGQNGGAEKNAEGLVTQYQQAHPNVKIKVIGSDNADVLLDKLTAGFDSGDYPDVSYAYGSWAGQLAASGKVLDLSNFVARPAFTWQDFPEAARATATVDGKVIGIPALVDNIAVIFNTRLFDAAGMPYPSDSWSWEDFRAKAKRLTSPARGIYGTAYSVSGSEDTTWHLWPLLWQHGGKILDGKKPVFNSTAGVAALETLRAMAVDDKSMYLDQTDEKYLPLFNNGHVGMVLSGPWALLDIKQANLPYGVSLLPGFNGDHETVSGPDIWVLFDHKDANRAGAARDFIRWLTSKDTDAKWNLAIGNLPLRTSEKDTPEFAEYVKQYPGGQKFFENLSNARKARPTISGYEEMSRNVGDAIAKVLQGAAKPKEALDEAAKKSAGALADS